MGTPRTYLDLTLYLGIDPGTNGAIAAFHNGEPSTHAMPETPRELIQLLERLSVENGTPKAVRCCVENVWATPVMGRASAFTFGKNVGRIETALAACAIPFDLVTPQRWQNVIGVPRSGQTKHGAKDKNLAKNRAIQLFPEFSVTQATADALLIAEYCRRVHAGVLIPSAGGHDGKTQATQQSSEVARRQKARA